jgi:hypothetical protein
MAQLIIVPYWVPNGSKAVCDTREFGSMGIYGIQAFSAQRCFLTIKIQNFSQDY